jgi:hypothetical protein
VSRMRAATVWTIFFTVPTPRSVWPPPPAWRPRSS